MTKQEVMETYGVTEEEFDQIGVLAIERGSQISLGCTWCDHGCSSYVTERCNECGLAEYLFDLYTLLDWETGDLLWSVIPGHDD